MLLITWPFCSPKVLKFNSPYGMRVAVNIFEMKKGASYCIGIRRKPLAPCLYELIF